MKCGGLYPTHFTPRSHAVVPGIPGAPGNESLAQWDPAAWAHLSGTANRLHVRSRPALDQKASPSTINITRRPAHRVAASFVVAAEIRGQI